MDTVAMHFSLINRGNSQNAPERHAHHEQRIVINAWSGPCHVQGALSACIETLGSTRTCGRSLTTGASQRSRTTVAWSARARQLTGNNESVWANVFVSRLANKVHVHMAYALQQQMNTNRVRIVG